MQEIWFGESLINIYAQCFNLNSLSVVLYDNVLVNCWCF